MSIYDIETASTFGALHGDNLADGSPLDSWTLRTMARSSNLLSSHGEPMLSAVFDSDLSNGDETSGGLLGFGCLHWFQILPGPMTVPKKPGTNSLELCVNVAITGSGGAGVDEIEIQVGTIATGGILERPSVSMPNVVSCVSDGSNSWQTFTLSGIPADPGPFEKITIAIRGKLSNPPTLANVGTYGSPNTGTVEAFWHVSESVCNLYSSAATWNTGPGVSTLADGGHAIRVVDSNGVEMLTPRTIIETGRDTGSGSTRYLYAYPGLDFPLQTRELRNQTFEIVELPKWRFASIQLWTEDRT